VQVVLRLAVLHDAPPEERERQRGEELRDAEGPAAAAKSATRASVVSRAWARTSPWRRCALTSAAVIVRTSRSIGSA
jgi:hypothetical protein